jgi:hypothetical protein
VYRAPVAKAKGGFLVTSEDLRTVEQVPEDDEVATADVEEGGGGGAIAVDRIVLEGQIHQKRMGEDSNNFATWHDGVVNRWVGRGQEEDGGSFSDWAKRQGRDQYWDRQNQLAADH